MSNSLKFSGDTPVTKKFRTFVGVVIRADISVNQSIILVMYKQRKLPYLNGLIGGISGI